MNDLCLWIKWGVQKVKRKPHSRLLSETVTDGVELEKGSCFRFIEAGDIWIFKGSEAGVGLAFNPITKEEITFDLEGFYRVQYVYAIQTAEELFQEGGYIPTVLSLAGSGVQVANVRYFKNEFSIGIIQFGSMSFAANPNTEIATRRIRSVDLEEYFK